MQPTRTFAGWPGGAKAAVCLTYDDALPCHHQLVAPALEAHGLRGTFFTPLHGDLIASTDSWRALAQRGHELGNHTIFHPCRREGPQAPGDWIKPWNNLALMDAPRFRSELEIANFVLSLIDGRTARTYGNTCHNTHVGPADQLVDLAPMIAELFVAGRGGCTGVPANPSTVDLACVGTAAADGKRLADWIALVEQARTTGGILILTFHAVGKGVNRLQVEADEHTQFLDYLRAQSKQIWTVPLVEAAKWIRGIPDSGIRLAD